jgi:hypothetical protein
MLIYKLFHYLNRRKAGRAKSQQSVCIFSRSCPALFGVLMSYPLVVRECMGKKTEVTRKEKQGEDITYLDELQTKVEFQKMEVKYFEMREDPLRYNPTRFYILFPNGNDKKLREFIRKKTIFEIYLDKITNFSTV